MRNELVVALDHLAKWLELHSKRFSWIWKIFVIRYGDCWNWIVENFFRRVCNKTKKLPSCELWSNSNLEVDYWKWRPSEALLSNRRCLRKHIKYKIIINSGTKNISATSCSTVSLSMNQANAKFNIFLFPQNYGKIKLLGMLFCYEIFILWGKDNDQAKQQLII